jgi:DNA repair protein RecO (recombination protein O)
MEWRDEAFVLGVRRHGETSVILEAMTREHGRHLGLVRGGRSRAMQPVLQPGNAVGLVWRARLDEHLGIFAVEGLALNAARFIASRHALFAIGHLTALVRLLPERDPHPAIHAALAMVIGVIDDIALVPALVARFEMEILSELGFGLDLTACAATGRRDDLAYISPKSGRAVSREAGEPWRDRLLRLPPFLTGAGTDVTADDVMAAFRLTGFFLERDVFGPRGLPISENREAFLRAVAVVD